MISVRSYTKYWSSKELTRFQFSLLTILVFYSCLEFHHLCTVFKRVLAHLSKWINTLKHKIKYMSSKSKVDPRDWKKNLKPNKNIQNVFGQNEVGVFFQKRKPYLVKTIYFLVICTGREEFVLFHNHFL